MPIQYRVLLQQYNLQTNVLTAGQKDRENIIEGTSFGAFVLRNCSALVLKERLKTILWHDAKYVISIVIQLRQSM